MSNSNDTIVKMINAHRVVIDVMAAAAQIGVTRIPTVDVYALDGGTGTEMIISFGFPEMDGEFPASEVARWQLVMGSPWEVYTSVNGTRRMRFAYTTYEGHKVHLRFSEPREIREHVKALVSG